MRRWLNCSTEFHLEPMADIQARADGGWSWLSADPQFALRSKSNVALAGFYMAEVSISNVSTSLAGQFYADEGNGYIEANAFQLPLPTTGAEAKTIKRICYFDNHIKALRFDPSDEAGGCGELSIKLVKLTKARAKALMKKKLAAKAEGFRDDLGLLDLYKHYDELFNKPAAVSYQSWISEYENRDSVLQGVINSLAKKPLISIVCPVYNTKPEWLVTCIESVINQSYSNWQLILIDDASTEKAHLEYLKKYQQNEPRIDVLYLDNNVHISAATNMGIDLAAGDYVTFLDHDDELAPNALAEMCIVINAKPGIKIIYSDEDLISESGERIVPHFKSDWNVELLRAHNYITHLCCYEAGLLNTLGGMRMGYEGAQDYDLILRASTVVDDSEVHHIAQILYHWRMVEGSTALSADAKSYATETGLKALKDHLQTINPAKQAHHSDRTNFYTVKYPLPVKLPKVSIVIPTRDGLDVLKPCINSLESITEYKNYEVIILDNGSLDKQTLLFLSELASKPNFKVIRDDGGFNYSRINNHAVKHVHADSELICLLNNDIEITQADWLTEMVSVAIRPDIGCVGAKLLYPDGSIQHAGIILGLGGYAAHSHRGIGGNEAGYFCRAQVRQQLSAVTGACLVVKRSIYEKVDGLDEAFEVAYNDVDFCLRVQALGLQNIYTPFAKLIHHESKTRGEDTSPEKTKRFDKEKQLLVDRWGELLKNDPFYNPNLTRAREDFSL